MFLISHEYTHHIHQHIGENRPHGVWTEFPHDGAAGSLYSQAQELDADGYAAYLVLAHLLRGERRQSALDLLSGGHVPAVCGDELLLSCFFLAVMAFFCAFWVEDGHAESVYDLRHPPPPIRVKYLIQIVEMWCRQNRSVPKEWFSAERLQELFGAAAGPVEAATSEARKRHMSFLRSPDGAEYDRRLFESFEKVRRKRDK